jgi:hypothetical protein
MTDDAELLRRYVEDKSETAFADLVQRHRPLGNPPPNGCKYFSTAEVLELAKDRSWLAKITNTLSQHWRKKNARKKDRVTGATTSGPAP